jgi:hypothetical protein
VDSKAARVARGEVVEPPKKRGALDGARPGEVGNRRAVGEFTSAARRNARETAAALPFEDFQNWYLMTLTYGREFPMDGKTVMQHKKRFEDRWRRMWGAGVVAIWVKEFQRRGAIHLHYWVSVPKAAEMEDDPTMGAGSERWPWACDVWSDVVGSVRGSAHHHMGVNMRKMEYGPTRLTGGRVAKYFYYESAKYWQKEIPEGFTNIGQWWGYLGEGFKPVRHELAVPMEAAMGVRRALVKLRDRKAGRRLAAPRGRDGVTAFVDDGATLAVRLVRWAESRTTAPRSVAE